MGGEALQYHANHILEVHLAFLIIVSMLHEVCDGPWSSLKVKSIAMKVQSIRNLAHTDTKGDIHHSQAALKGMCCLGGAHGSSKMRCTVIRLHTSCMLMLLSMAI